MLDLADIFGPGGVLAAALPGFTARRGQLHMAERVADALTARETLVVEAGTGTGKTFAYLVPALLSGQRVLISTGTRTLQDQLFSRDLPLVASAIGRPARVALLKGRANYLCHYRLARAGETEAQLQWIAPAGHRGGTPRNLLARIERWAHTTRRGDLAEVRGLSDDHPVWAQVTSTRETCLGARCPDISRCHVVQARREALDADVVIVNHHLLLADLALKEDGFGDLLGSADAVILDEAHQVADLATQFFGATVATRQLELLLRDLRAALPPDAATSVAALREVEDGITALRACVPAAAGRLPFAPGVTAAGAGVAALQEALGGLSQSLAGVALTDELAPLSERLARQQDALSRIAATDEIEGARTLEINSRGVTLSLLPFDISGRFRALLQSRRGAWIFTSATLSLGEEFGHFTGRLGLDDAATLKIDSPFDFERQSLLYLPRGLPEPSAPEYVGAVIQTAVALIEAGRGGAFVLFTSHRALALGAAELRQRWGEPPPYRLFVQGEAPRERLLEEFRADGNAVLLGTASFWEGVDVKGAALRLVVIEKLPFASPDDPLVRARIEHLTHTGGNAFRDYQLPEAALTLKQGAGRLIRSEDDYGVVAICDPRLVGRSYGRVFLAALPAMRLTRDGAEARRFLRRHAAPAARPAVAAS